MELKHFLIILNSALPAVGSFSSNVLSNAPHLPNSFPSLIFRIGMSIADLPYELELTACAEPEPVSGPRCCGKWKFRWSEAVGYQTAQARLGVSESELNPTNTSGFSLGFFAGCICFLRLSLSLVHVHMRWKVLCDSASWLVETEWLVNHPSYLWIRKKESYESNNNVRSSALLTGT